MAERLSSLEDEQIQRNATWARRFMGTAENQGAPRNRYEELQQDQNDSRRRLYKNEIDDAVARDKARTAEEFEALQIRNPAVGRLMLDREKEERAAEESRFRRNLDVQKFEWTKEKDRIGTEINKLREQREIAQQRRLLNEALLKEKNQLRQDEQTFIAQQYIQGMADKGQMPGSPEFAYGAAEVLRQNPYIDDDYRARLVEDMQLIEDPKEAAAAAARGDRVTQTQGADGKWRYTYVRTPEKEDSGKADLYKDRSFATSRADRLEKEILNYPKDKQGSEEYKRAVEQRNEFRRRADEADAKIRAGGQPKQSASDSPPAVMGERVMVDAAAQPQTQTAPPPVAPQGNGGAKTFSTKEEFSEFVKTMKPGERVTFGGKTYVK